MARGGAAIPKQSALRELPKHCPSYAAPARKRQIWQEGRTTLGLNSALPGRLWMKIKVVAMGPQRKAQRFAHVAAREQDLRAAFSTDTRAAATPSYCAVNLDRAAW